MNVIISILSVQRFDPIVSRYTTPPPSGPIASWENTTIWHLVPIVSCLPPLPLTTCSPKISGQFGDWKAVFFHVHTEKTDINQKNPFRTNSLSQCKRTLMGRLKTHVLARQAAALAVTSHYPPANIYFKTEKIGCSALNVLVLISNTLLQWLPPKDVFLLQFHLKTNCRMEIIACSS